MLFHRQASVDAPGRAERGWGPFSGRQLATIVVALILALLVPTTAYAFTVGHTSVTDAVTKATANVDPTGALQVAQAGPANYFQAQTGVFGSTALLATPPAGSGLIVTSLHVSAFSSAVSPYPYVQFFVASSASCSGLIAVVDEVDEGVVGVTVLPFVPGYAIPSGDFLCANSLNGFHGIVTTVGYTVPASTVTTPKARTSAPLRPAARP